MTAFYDLVAKHAKINDLFSEISIILLKLEGCDCIFDQSCILSIKTGQLHSKTSHQFHESRNLKSFRPLALLREITLLDLTKD